jgi:hypothetical protein
MEGDHLGQKKKKRVVTSIFLNMMIIEDFIPLPKGPY